MKIIKTDEQIQYNVKSSDQLNEVAGECCIQSMKIDSGDYICVFYVPTENKEYFESILDEMDTVISYKEL